ncbi:phage virion morphogenesis protein [Agrobacterium vitis]|uniref:phage virion morphogenesis protein n=1 Tax=Rhizobium/Agrobacterium group TaxID=227290 RepID=UPI0012E95620|nr:MULTISPECIES: phage virion morphogenesis protein [Rhizobium/Agrobacterium group]MCF1485077.1 phage virion morphogenesis protein [Allorhizobium ampelinum]MCF1492491.1 phage virion morphogenesis protein [Allorhizobium ampelinum]MVA44482.1 phage virion morphogenesis protein [Agrobacterium vitis]
MVATTITIDAKEVEDALSRFLAAAADLSPVFKNIGEYEAQATKQRFRDQKDPDGNAWQALNPLYKETKKGPRILTGQTGDLSRIIWQLASSTSVDIGSDMIYARIHNEGGTIVPKNAAALIFSMGGKTFAVKSVKIPKRQFLGINDEDRVRIEEIIEDHFLDAIEQAGSSN